MKCYICREIFPDEDLIEHHINYENNDTILVCPSCHDDIHRGDLYPMFKPIGERPRGVKSGGYKSLYLPVVYHQFVKQNIKDFSKWVRIKLDEEKEHHSDFCKEKIEYWQKKLEKTENTA